ncbi:phage tail tape measure protein [Epilithonimonas vandammei]|uniref:Phage tail tape measure protein n=1 Tax=Epilithonimonas vandammei TaxID=2487072 RepID=A0A3G8ZES4_9FLAO|nr:phage tail tape measure protein [Epilithonimonas vandammei]AZI55678.1 phage tail tape measure protein [Epilithonimonas vandammei]
MSNVLEYILNLKDGITDKITKISSASDKTTSKMQKLEKQTLDNQKAFDKAGKAAEGYRGKLSAMVSAIPGADVLMNPYVIATAALIGAGKAGMSFDEGMAKINTTAQLTAPQLEQLKDNIIETGMAAKANDLYALPEAYEKIISQTGDVIQSQDILKESIIGSKAGFTDQSIVADALAQSLSLIGKENATAREVLDTFFAAKRVGAGEFKDFANYMPGLIASGKALGITYKNVAGQFAFMTGKGFSAEKSAVLLENAYSALGKSDIREGLQAAGINVFDKKE